MCLRATYEKVYSHRDVRCECTRRNNTPVKRRYIFLNARNPFYDTQIGNVKVRLPATLVGALVTVANPREARLDKKKEFITRSETVQTTAVCDYNCGLRLYIVR